MFDRIINFLKDPQLVANIQEYFEIDVREHKKLCYTIENNNPDLIVKQNGCTLIESHESEFSSCLLRNGLHDEKKIHSSSDNEKKPFRIAGSNNSPTDIKKSKSFIKNYFWYYLFLFSTELGDEVFYLTFIPFLFWNIDAVVGRKVILVWSIVMTVGQVLKDIIRWPRPACPPAVRLQKKWSEEYGMPSTHASISVAIPFSMLIFTMNRYNYSIELGITIALTWCTLICISRLYLGMHTVLDVVAGLLLAVIVMILLVPLVDVMNYYFSTNLWALLILIIISIVLIIYYPCSDRWTSTRGDTTMVVSVFSGINAGTWLNNKTGLMLPSLYSSPYNITWPTFAIFIQMILRTVVGLSFIFSNKFICKHLTYKIMCAILGIDVQQLLTSENSLENKNKTLVDLFYKFIFCFMLGINIIYFLPKLFYVMGLDRPAFYTEV